jgi:tetratricopeptide (TPR) repeat protein
VAGFQHLRGDSASAWIAEGLSQMIAAKLARSPAVEIVVPQRVREVRMRAGSDKRGSLADKELADLGRRLGAQWVVTGGVSGVDSALTLELDLHSARTGKLEKSYAVSARSVLSLADLAASRLLDAAGAAGVGPHLAEVETASLAAYEHYVRAVEAFTEGRSTDGRDHLDAAIALDSGFVSALRERLQLAFLWGERDVVRSLTEAMRRNASRATDWDRLYVAAFNAFRNGEHSRGEALGRALVERYQNDPRAYALLGNIYVHHGHWNDAERVMRQQLALDSLAAMAGTGICVPCGAYGALAVMLIERGDLDAAERVVRRLLELQPDFAGAWSALSIVLAAQERFEASLDAQRRSIALVPNDAYARARIGRILIAMRRYDAADSAIRELGRHPSPDVRKQAYDLRFMLQRELGQFRASNRTIDSMLAEFPDTRELQLVQGNNLGRLGEYRRARQTYETLNHSLLRVSPSSLPPATPLAGDHARAFAWQHALAADAIAESGDTLLLRVLADSIERESQRSYYARDWRLHHHVRGLIAMHGKRYDEAARAFEQARWGGHGWTRTLAELARAYMALGRPNDAIAIVRAVYLAPLDAMGRYLPRSEADYLMALAFAQAGRPDSAAVYASHVRRAWANADPPVRAKLHDLDP